MDIVIQIAEEFDSPDADPPKIKKLVKAVCRRFNLSKALVSIAMVDDARIRKINKRFLNKDCSTDCLSFDLSDDGDGPAKSFELIVNAERAAREANLQGHSGEAELALYITHSLLHNLGFDDSTKTQAKKMHDTEDEILQQLGYGLIYNKTTENL